MIKISVGKYILQDQILYLMVKVKQVYSVYYSHYFTGDLQPQNTGISLKGKTFNLGWSQELALPFDVYRRIVVSTIKGNIEMLD